MDRCRWRFYDCAGAAVSADAACSAYARKAIRPTVMTPRRNMKPTIRLGRLRGCMRGCIFYPS